MLDPHRPPHCGPSNKYLTAAPFSQKDRSISGELSDAAHHTAALCGNTFPAVPLLHPFPASGSLGSGHLPLPVHKISARKFDGSALTPPQYAALLSVSTRRFPEEMGSAAGSYRLSAAPHPSAAEGFPDSQTLYAAKFPFCRVPARCVNAPVPAPVHADCLHYGERSHSALSVMPDPIRPACPASDAGCSYPPVSCRR